MELNLETTFKFAIWFASKFEKHSLDIHNVTRYRFKGSGVYAKGWSMEEIYEEFKTHLSNEKQN